jgi:hypothetical protein
MASKLYRLYCEVCNWKKITDGSDIVDFYEILTSPIPGGAPKKDPTTNAIIEAKSTRQPRKFRCPQCGRVVIPRKIADPQGELDDKIEMEEKLKERAENERLE